MGPTVAAIDCGTNSTRLLIARGDGSTVDRRMRITRLGEGVDRTGSLSPQAMERTRLVLEEYRAAMDTHGVSRVRAIATSAVRDAGNAAGWLAAAAGVIGSEPQVLSGDEEGRLSYRGATSELAAGVDSWVVVDVGGGSTELVTSGAGGIEAVSLDVGCVRVTERWLLSDPPAPAELAAARQSVADLVRRAAGQHATFLAAGAERLVGLAGTVSALAVLKLGLESYDRTAVHRARLGRADVSRLLDALIRVPVSERRRWRGMERDRADVLAGGALVLDTVMEVLGFAELMVSESDILDGIVAELLEVGIEP